MLKSNLVLLGILASLISVTSIVSAEDIKLDGSIRVHLKKHRLSYTSPLAQSISLDSPSSVKLLNVKLSNQAQATFSNRMTKSNKTLSSNSNSFGSSSSGIQLGMNNVPVLNQGMHGSCVTFASTAAIDAVLQKGDYISQLCLLNFGNYLSHNAYVPSGWNGNWGKIVLSNLMNFGIVTKDQQQIQGCGGLTEYPLNALDSPENEMSFENYHTLSIDLHQFGVSYSPILDIDQMTFNQKKVIADVKASLKRGDRVLTGVLLVDITHGSAGASGYYKQTNDTWLLTPENKVNPDLLEKDIGGHEMVITGYDDNAIAVDDQNRKHKGLFTLRNSWGSQAGDHGDFYMTYEYFATFVLEANSIHKY